MPKLLIKNANELITPVACPSRGKSLNELRVWQNGSLYIENGTIAEIGYLRDFENKISQDAVIIDASGKTVLPGFVDSHTHLVFSGTREVETAMRIQGATYQEIAGKGGGILSTVKATRAASKKELKKIARLYLTIALQHGTTTMEIKSGYGLELQTELKMLEVIDELDQEQPIELVSTFMGAHAVPPEHSKKDYIDEVISMLQQAATRAKFCDVFCENGYFDLDDGRLILEQAKKFGLVPRMHVDQFSNNGGVKLGVELGASSVDHLEKISDEEISALAASNTCATLLPGVSFFLNYGYPPARKIIDQGCITALATNLNPGSCMTVSMQMIIAIACLQMRMTAEEAINAATVNGAFALGLPNVGTLEAGKQADVLILDVPNHRMLPYFFGVNHVEKVIKKGEIVWSRNAG